MSGRGLFNRTTVKRISMSTIPKMKYLSCFVCLFLIVISSCKKQNGCRPEQIDYKFATAKAIDTFRSGFSDPLFTYYGYLIKDGSSNVFTYEKSFKDCPEISDDEGTMTIIFEAPPGDSFLIKDSLQLIQAKCLVHMQCFCAPGSPLMVRQGSIEGKRLSTNSWQVKFNLKMPWNDQSLLNFDKVFTKQN